VRTSRRIFIIALCESCVKSFSFLRCIFNYNKRYVSRIPAIIS
jgi:hypothetical protein